MISSWYPKAFLCSALPRASLLPAMRLRAWKLRFALAIAGLGVYVLLEKLLPRERWLSHAAGIGVFAVGIWLVAPLA